MNQRSKEAPLTTKGLNAFLVSMHNEVEASNLQTDTKEMLLMELANTVLSVGEPDNKQYPYGLEMSRSKKPLPETLGDLKKLLQLDTIYTAAEPSEQAAQVLIRKMWDKSCRAAEKTMGQESSLGR